MGKFIITKKYINIKQCKTLLINPNSYLYLFNDNDDIFIIRELDYNEFNNLIKTIGDNLLVLGYENYLNKKTFIITSILKFSEKLNNELDKLLEIINHTSCSEGLKKKLLKNPIEWKQIILQEENYL